MATNGPSIGELLTARASHLNMVQGVVTRLATSSANAKNFCVTIVAALLGIAFQQKLPSLLLVAPLVLISFAALDVYYLAQERRFRDLYGHLASRPLADAAQMDLSPSKLTASAYFAAVRSFSTGGFYSLLLIVGLALLPLIYEPPEEHRVGNHSGAAGSADARLPSGPAAVAARTGVDGRSPAAPDSERLRASGIAQPTADIGAERPVRNTTEPVADQKDVR